MVRHIKKILIVLATCLFWLISFAQKVEFKYIHKFSVKEGLSSYNIRKIVKDEYGYTWIATQDGLNRFDGRQFIHYNAGSPPQFRLPASDIRDLDADTANHLLWVLTNIDGLFSINTTNGTVTAHIPIPYTVPDDWSQCFKKIGAVLWIGCFQGVKLYDTEQRKWLPDAAIPGKANTNPLSSETGGIIEGNNGNVWLFINGHGVTIYNHRTRNIISYIDEKKLFDQKGGGKIKFFSPVQHTDSTIIVGTSNGLKLLHVYPDNKLEDHTRKNKTISSLLSTPVYSVSLLPDRSLYIGLDTKTIHLDAGLSEITTIRDKDGYSDNTNWLGQARAIANDSKNIWIGSKEGLSYMTFESFASEIYSSRTSEFSNLSHIYDVEPVNDSEILTGGKNGLYLINRKTKSCTTVKPGLIVNNLFRNYDSTIIVTTSAGNFIYKNKTLIPLPTLFPELRPYQYNMLVDNVIIGDSVMLIGTDDVSGLIVWNFKRKTTYVITATTSPLSLGSNTINDIYAASDGAIWVLGDKIVTLFDSRITSSKVIRIIDKLTKKEQGPLFDAAETKNNYWLCAYGIGLLKLDKDWNLLNIYNEDMGLSNNGVYKLFKYDREKLLITSNDGISIFDNSSKIITKIFEEKGLHANTFEEATGCSWNNEIYTGGPNGFSVISYSSFLTNDRPVLYINNIRVEKPFNQQIDSFSNNFFRFVIPNNYSQTSVRFSAINYSSSDRITFRYKITELHNDWINLNTKNFIDFIGVKPGEYTLQVKAVDENGIESEIKSLTLIFRPKWYQTWQFQALIGLAIFALIYAFYRLRINQLKKEQRIRSKLASDLHDDLGSTMNSVKLYANLAIMEYPNGKYPPLIKESTQEAITGIRDMIWVLDDRKDSVEDLLLRINNFATPLCEAAAMQYIQDISDTIRSYKLGQEEKRNLYMMLKETINNAIKYAGSPGITVTAYLIKSKPVFEISDQGKGFNSSIASEGNGLKNMKHRSAAIKYKLHITSTPGNGTLIRFEKE